MKKLIFSIIASAFLASCTTVTPNYYCNDVYCWVEDNTVLTASKGFYQEFTDTVTNVVYHVSVNRNSPTPVNITVK